MTDPTPTPQVRDVDREIVRHLGTVGGMSMFASIEDRLKHQAEVVARHLAPERDEAERWRDALEEIHRYAPNPRNCHYQTGMNADWKPCDAYYPRNPSMQSWCAPCLARVLLSPAPAPQGERGDA